MSNKKAEIINWYEKIPKKYILKSHNPHYDIHHIKLPFRMIICGSSGSGKTQTLLNLLYNMPDTFENIYIITKNKDEPLYNYLEDKLGKKGVHISEGLESLPNLDKFDKESQSLIILDDLVNEPKKQQQPICDFFIRARKKNCSLIYISQSFYAVPKLIRDNINYLIIKQVSSMKNLTMITRECSLGISKKQLTDIYNDATQKKTDFLLIDIDGEQGEKFRKNFDEVYEVEDELK